MMRGMPGGMWPKAVLGAGVLLCIGANLPPQEPGAEYDTVINYLSSDGLADPVTMLQRDIDSGKLKLDFDPEKGYLPAVLKLFNVPVSSQTLVFSKTSDQAAFTSPEKPRALYFNDHVFVGFAQGHPQLDVIAMDPKKGAIFFTVPQTPSDKPQFKRGDGCLNCHANAKTLGAPGLIIRSVQTLPDGRPRQQVNTFIAGHNNPLRERWGGWYVTGTHGADEHMGNAFLANIKPKDFQLAATSNITDLRDRFDTTKYLSPHSDTVALLVLDHATRMQNHITAAQYNSLHAIHDKEKGAIDEATFKKRIADAVEPMLAYMLLQDEAPLRGPVKGTSDFQSDFPKIGPHDKKGRSLREFELQTRVFRYPCSYYIYNETFDALPAATKDRFWQRLDEVLEGKDKSVQFSRMKPEEARAVKEILVETKPEFAAWLKNRA